MARGTTVNDTDRAGLLITSSTARKDILSGKTFDTSLGGFSPTSSFEGTSEKQLQLSAASALSGISRMSRTLEEFVEGEEEAYPLPEFKTSVFGSSSDPQYYQ